ncbi:hypothetical protein NC652_010722 [Populus alba x Populus x berolinensis]|nr:hypothetical protein NC652_010722 [Populus alba x Populus x berolinensis]
MPQKKTINKGERNSNRLSLSVSRPKTLAKTGKLIMANSKQLLILSFLAVAILVLSTLVQSSNASSSSSSSSHDRVLLARQRNAARFQIPSCSEMVSRSQCSHNPNCKWCKSEVLDDMCFSKAEAWRLPQQLCNGEHMGNESSELYYTNIFFYIRLLMLKMGRKSCKISAFVVNGTQKEALTIFHCDQEAKLLQDNPGRDAHAEQQSSGKPRPCSLLFHNIWKEERVNNISLARFYVRALPVKK